MNAKEIAQKTAPYIMALTTFVAAEGCSNASFTIKTPESSYSRKTETKDAEQIRYTKSVLHLSDNEPIVHIGDYSTSRDGDMKLRFIAGLYAGTIKAQTIESDKNSFKRLTTGTFDGRKNMTDLERAASLSDVNHDKIITSWEAETLYRKLAAEKAKTEYKTQNNTYKNSKTR